MKKMILNLVAALTLGGAVAATAVDAQPRDHERTVVRTTHTTVVHRAWHNNGNANNGARNRHRTCRTVWRRHQRIRTCRSW
jgi:Ni/Co efflux regulator RcnB